MTGVTEPEFVTGRVKPGDVIAGKYRVEAVLGEGGMGVVVSAHHVQLDERVALKLLLPAALKSAETIGRFMREARAAVKIKSEHVARVIDVGELENGLPYIVMEYLEGCDLAAALAKDGRMSTEQSVGFILQACEAVAEAHALGIVHRDLKPANLFLANRPSGPPIVKVLDFGISKAAPSASQPQLTKTNAIMGSPLYMSPEQIQSSKTVDLRSDIWSLGVILYELVGGAVPFPGEEMPEVIAGVLFGDLEPLRARRADVAPGFEAVVHRCLSKSPAERFADVGELAAALAPFGPPRSDVSVERIAHVLGQGPRDGSRRPATDSGIAVASRPDTDPAYAKTEGSPSSGENRVSGAPLTATSTTAKPVTQDTARTSGAPLPGKRSTRLMAAALLPLAGLGAFAMWRLASSPAGDAANAPGSVEPAPSSVPAPPQASAPSPGADPTATGSAVSGTAAPADTQPRAPSSPTASASAGPIGARAPSVVTRPSAAPPRAAASPPRAPVAAPSVSADPFGLQRK